MKYFSNSGPLTKWVCTKCLIAWWENKSYLAYSVKPSGAAVVCFACCDKKKKKEIQLVDEYVAIDCLVKATAAKELDFCILVAKNVAAESRYKAEKSEADLNRKSNLLEVQRMAELMVNDFTERRDLL